MSTRSAAKRFVDWLVLIAIIAMLLWSCRAFFDFGELFLRISGKTLIDRGSTGASEWQSFLARSARPEQEKSFSKIHRALAQASEGGKNAARVIFFERGMIIVNPHTRLPSQTLEPITVVRSELDLPGEVESSGSVFMRSEKEFSSSVEQSWSWAVEHAAELPRNAQIFLNEQSFASYLITAFVWYPRTVDVDPKCREIRDDETFDALFSDSSGLDRRDLSALKAKLRTLGYTHLVARENGVRRILTLGEAATGDSK